MRASSVRGAGLVEPFISNDPGGPGAGEELVVLSIKFRVNSEFKEMTYKKKTANFTSSEVDAIRKFVPELELMGGAKRKKAAAKAK